MTAAAGVRVRVTVTDAWDTVALDLEPTTTIAEIKRTALERTTGRMPDPSAYVVKFRGALVLDENRSIGDLGVPSGAALIVLPARRRPVR